MRETLLKTEEFKDSPVGRIPKDWEVRTMEEITTKIVDGVHKTPIYVESGVPFLTVENLTSGSGITFKNVRYVTPAAHAEFSRRADPRPSDVLVSKDGTLGIARIVPDDLPEFSIFVSVAQLRPNEKLVLPSFICRFFETGEYERQLGYRSAGTGLKHIHLEHFRAFLIATPPIAEQRRIAKILDTVDEAIAHTSSLIAKLKQMKAGLLHDLLTRGLDENGELRDAIAHPEQFKDSPLGRIPKDWEVQPLSNFSRKEANGFVNGPFGSDLLASELRDEGVPVIYVRDIKPGFYDRVSTVHVSEQKARELSFCNVRYGDVLVAKVGDPPCDTAPYLLSSNSIVTQDVIRIRPGDDTETYFLSSLINSNLARKAIEFITIAGTRKRVSLTEFKHMQLPKPPYKEQCRISSILRTYDIRIRTEEGYREKLKLQKQGLMHDLLTGKVRVKNA
jgi:type I restriction enzyme S subunit